MSLGFKPTRQPRCTTMVSRSEEEFGRTARREAVSSRDCHKHGSCDVDPVAVETENLIPQHIEPRCSEPTCGQHETAEAAIVHSTRRDGNRGGNHPHSRRRTGVLPHRDRRVIDWKMKSDRAILANFPLGHNPPRVSSRKEFPSQLSFLAFASSASWWAPRRVSFESIHQ